MNGTITVFHIRQQSPTDVEQALTTIFTAEECEARLRLEGSYASVLSRLTEPMLDASYRYLICRPHPASAWTPVLELGNRTNDLDLELSKTLGGCDVFTTYVFGDVLSGYRAARSGALIDQYTSDPTYYDNDVDTTEDGGEPVQAPRLELRGHPDVFANLLPSGTTPEDFTRVVLRPGYWERLDASDGTLDDDVVDEVDRMRCIGLALELWGPEDYPFTRELEDIPNNVVGPVIALAYM